MQCIGDEGVVKRALNEKNGQGGILVVQRGDVTQEILVHISKLARVCWGVVVFRKVITTQVYCSVCGACVVCACV